jgi:hypothetical protein
MENGIRGEKEVQVKNVLVKLIPETRKHKTLFSALDRRVRTFDFLRSFDYPEKH